MNSPSNQHNNQQGAEMSEVEKRVLVAIEGADKNEAREALLLALHRLMKTDGFMNFLVPIRH